VLQPFSYFKVNTPSWNEKVARVNTMYIRILYNR
jgi:hypothetical protein